MNVSQDRCQDCVADRIAGIALAVGLPLCLIVHHYAGVRWSVIAMFAMLFATLTTILCVEWRSTLNERSQ